VQINFIVDAFVNDCYYQCSIKFAIKKIAKCPYRLVVVRCCFYVIVNDMHILQLVLNYGSF